MTTAAGDGAASAADTSAGDLLALMDWKRRVLELYREIRHADDLAAAWRRWRMTRDELFASHAQSPLPEDARPAFSGLAYFDYDPDARVLATVRPVEPSSFDVPTSGGGYRFIRFAIAAFELGGADRELALYWLDGYGGGICLPFADATSGTATYGAGRYLLDTVKGADLGMKDDRLVLDFNFAYNPSCAYDPRWVCPLAPPENRLGVAIEAGERST